MALSCGLARRRLRPLVGLGLLVAGLLAAGPAAAQAERILEFRSHVTVHPDAGLTVTETIAVEATGREIKRGIVRDFPTRYRDRLGGFVRVGFEILGIRRDGAAEPYHTEATREGVRIFIGRSDVFLRPGRYRYEIRYRTDRQLGFFEDYDELYWNVTGNDWTFPIERAEAVIDLPPGANVVQQAGYTGPRGARGEDYAVERPAAGRIVFRSTRPLDPGEGLTVAVAWPKGFVAEPDSAARLGYFVDDNGSLLAALGGLMIVLAYYLAVWSWVGRDPEAGTIIPLFEPPEGFSPAAVRYLRRMGYDSKAFAAAVVDMAVKGFLRIEEYAAGRYELIKRGGDETALSSGERRIAGKLFGAWRDRIELKQSNHKTIGGAVKAFRESLRREFERGFFTLNRGYFYLGAVLSLLGLLAIVVVAPVPEEAAMGGLFIAGWTAGCTMLAVMVLRALRRIGRTSGVTAVRALVGAIFLTAFAVPFFGMEFVVLAEFAGLVSIPALVVFSGTVLTNVLFYHLLKARSVAGRKLLDEIEGFRLYLSVAEKERLGILNPPERTPELFEQLLPYALALDVEHEWSAQFADTLAAASVDGTTRGYRPGWYGGRSFDGRGLEGLAGSIGDSLSGAVAGSARAPGSSSGSGGGGSSGGGGGGGGGSGW